MKRLKVVYCAALSALVFLSACTYAPENNEWVDWTDIDFHGFAQNPSATIEIQAYHQRDGVWQTIHTVTSNATAATLSGDSLYSWSANLDTTVLPNGHCYWGSPGTCSIPPGAASAQFRFKERGSDLAFLVTFDQGGLDCVLEKLTQGDTWLSAGASCAGANSPVLTLRILT